VGNVCSCGELRQIQTGDKGRLFSIDSANATGKYSYAETLEILNLRISSITLRLNGDSSCCSSFRRCVHEFHQFEWTNKSQQISWNLENYILFIRSQWHMTSYSWDSLNLIWFIISQEIDATCHSVCQHCNWAQAFSANSHSKCILSSIGDQHWISFAAIETNEYNWSSVIASILCDGMYRVWIIGHDCTLTADIIVSIGNFLHSSIAI
jgi:hypothetical protein